MFVLWQGGLLVLDGRLTAGALVGFLLYTITIAASVGALATSFTAYQEAVGAAERVFEILEMEPADRGSGGARAASGAGQRRGGVRGRELPLSARGRAAVDAGRRDPAGRAG